MRGLLATCIIVSILGLAGRHKKNEGCIINDTVKLSRNKHAFVYLYGVPRMAEINPVLVPVATC